VADRKDAAVDGMEETLLDKPVDHVPT
jgi:hypothetical protein